MMKPTTQEKIKTDIINELFWDSRVNAANIAIEIRNGTAILSGTVPSFYERTVAYNDVQTITGGYLDIKNQIEVELSKTIHIPSDEDIERQIKTNFDWNPVIESDDIAVSVAAGFVTLEGTVTSFWKKHRVEDIASNVIGVTAIRNKLRVVPTEKIEDDLISKQIVERMTRMIDVDPGDVGVKVANGIVTLNGTVPTWVAYIAAYDAALYTSGVTEINDQLHIDKDIA